MVYKYLLSNLWRQTDHQQVAINLSKSHKQTGHDGQLYTIQMQTDLVTLFLFSSKPSCGNFSFRPLKAKDTFSSYNHAGFHPSNLITVLSWSHL